MSSQQKRKKSAKAGAREEDEAFCMLLYKIGETMEEGRYE
jgi:hypothetical protein